MKIRPKEMESISREDVVVQDGRGCRLMKVVQLLVFRADGKGRVDAKGQESLEIQKIMAKA